ncbi:hypothetical protein OJAV_G00050160 [Oryzias javanicus]|uniref:Uncharacterized protein n=1 Tax=Oryzias javanicus TaxID=123683 RepID=A0A437D9H5_ORYJA|nr:hypothetical protein OJAV_G00050160 [Oryzias javanicus]
MKSSVLSGGRERLMADLAHAEPYDSGALWASSSSSELHSKTNTHLHKSFYDHSSKEVLPAKRSMSAPSKKERISFRDSPVHESGGWGGGRKRGRLTQ